MNLAQIKNETDKIICLLHLKIEQQQKQHST